MTIEIGKRVPNATLSTIAADGPQTIHTDDYFKGKKVVLFAVPGAFTPTCSNNHLPGYVENRDAIHARGVDKIAVLSVNDHFVMKAWANFTGAEGKIDFLADGSGLFVKALGLDQDLSARGMGLRAKRFSMIVEDGVVTALNIEEIPGQTIESGAARILELL